MAAGKEDDTERDQPPPREETAERTGDVRSGSRRSEGGEERAGRVSAPRAMRYASEQLEELLGRAPESVSAVKPAQDGWQADVEVLEVERIPETTSVMASYRVTLDEKGELMSYERTRRYTRGQIDRPA